MITMKSNIVPCFAAIALACFNVNFGVASNGGSHDTGNDDQPGHHRGETNEIDGHEVFHGHIVLLPTTNAPSTARGTAELQQENEHGSVFYKVEVRAYGVAAGSYSVSAVLFSDSSTASLGTLTAPTGRVAKADLLLPSGVAISDIGQIIV